MVKGLPVEDRLDGVSNYGSWKPRVLLTLEENEVKDFALIAVPFLDDATQQATWRKCQSLKDLAGFCEESLGISYGQDRDN